MPGWRLVWRAARSPRPSPRSPTSSSRRTTASPPPPRRGRPTSATWSGGSPRRPSSWRRRHVPGRSCYDYAVLRVVPRVEREEFVNAGVILFCLERDFLGARVALDRARVVALQPDADLPLIEEHLAAIPRICAGGPEAGPIG